MGSSVDASADWDYRDTDQDEESFQLNILLRAVIETMVWGKSDFRDVALNHVKSTPPLVIVRLLDPS